MLPMCSPKVFPTTHRFHSICFAQIPPLLTYIAGTKEEALHLSIESFILRNFHSFNFFLQWANQIDSLQKKSCTCEAPQLMKQDKYPQLCPLTAHLVLRPWKVLQWVLNVLHLTLVWSLDTGDASSLVPFCAFVTIPTLKSEAWLPMLPLRTTYRFHQLAMQFYNWIQGPHLSVCASLMYFELLTDFVNGPSCVMESFKSCNLQHLIQIMGLKGSFCR